ncbi:MAG: beta-lactamase family protein [Mucilaginibacter polytrichastri]|nr:beta-lactamase family protein [Mucilaginibacter polytrichastri]
MRYFFVLGFLLASPVYAQQDFAALDTWLKTHTAEMNGRSTLMIWKDGRIVYSHSENQLTRRQIARLRMLSRNANTDDFSPQSKQPVASCSKWLSAALVMTFVDEGKLRLADTIGKFLPAMRRSGKGAITIAQCLSHTTGIQSPPLMRDLQGIRRAASMDEAVAHIAKLPVEGRAGSVFHYGNTGLQLAGAVLEKISGKSFQVLFEERIAKPLGMKNTGFGDRPVALPAGGASSTPDDYLRFLAMILNNGTSGHQKIIGENSLAEMQKNRLTPDVKTVYKPPVARNEGYGFGEWVDGDVLSSPGLFGSFPWVDKKRKYCAFLMTYSLENEGRGERFRELKALIDRLL